PTRKSPITRSGPSTFSEPPTLAARAGSVGTSAMEHPAARAAVRASTTIAASRLIANRKLAVPLLGNRFRDQGTADHQGAIHGERPLHGERSADRQRLLEYAAFGTRTLAHRQGCGYGAAHGELAGLDGTVDGGWAAHVEIAADAQRTVDIERAADGVEPGMPEPSDDESAEGQESGHRKHHVYCVSFRHSRRPSRIRASVVGMAVGGVGSLREDFHRRKRRTAAALEFGEFRLGLGLGVAPPNLLHPRIEVGAVDFAVDAGLGEDALDGFADLLEGADVIVVGNGFERLLDSDAGLGIAQPREHPDLLDPEFLDLALESDQVFLGVFGLAREFGEFLAQPRAIGFEFVLALKEDERALILVHVGGLSGLLLDLGEFGGLGAQLAFELVAHVDDAGGRRL